MVQSHQGKRKAIRLSPNASQEMEETDSKLQSVWQLSQRKQTRPSHTDSTRRNRRGLQIYSETALASLRCGHAVQASESLNGCDGITIFMTLSGSHRRRNQHRCGDLEDPKRRAAFVQANGISISNHRTKASHLRCG